MVLLFCTETETVSFSPGETLDTVSLPLKALTDSTASDAAFTPMVPKTVADTRNAVRISEIILFFIPFSFLWTDGVFPSA